MGKYTKIGNVVTGVRIIANELAELNRLKRLEMSKNSVRFPSGNYHDVYTKEELEDQA
jgi:hypothetical protein